MTEKAEKVQKVDVETRPDLPGGVTHDAPKKADQESGPYIGDAEAHDPPVRTNRPEQPIAQTLASGAGAHEPVTDPHIGADGRYYADPEDAKNLGLRGWDADESKVDKKAESK